MAVAQTIETGANNALNVGLGVFKTVEAQIQEIQASLTKTYGDLVARGAADNSEVAVSLRSQLDRGISAVRDAQAKVESVVKK